MGGKNSVSQESEKARKVSGNQLSRFPTVLREIQSSNLQEPDKSELSKALSREAKQLFNLPARSPPSSFKTFGIGERFWLLVVVL